MNKLEKNLDIVTNYNLVTVEHVAFGGGGKVANVLVDKNLSINEQLENAYMLTQNIEDGWWNNENVKKITKKDAVRSTSMEDIMHINNDKYVVAAVGFQKIN